MTQLFGLTGNEIIFFKTHVIVNGDYGTFKMSKAEALNHLIKFCEFLRFGEFGAESVANSTYVVCQNTLLKQENIPLEGLRILQSFSEFGRSSLIDLLKAWESGGRLEMEKTFRALLGPLAGDGDGFGNSHWEELREDYAEISRNLFMLRYAAFQKYKSVEQANNLIDRIGLEEAAKLSSKEFLERLEIRKTRGGLTEMENYGLALCSALSGEWRLIGLNRTEVLGLIEGFCEAAELDEGAERAVQSIFVPTQNGLMNFRRDDFYTIQKEPPFSDFGRENLVKFLNAWEQGGKAALEEEFNRVFSDGWENRKPKNEIVRILSGDGETEETAIKFSTSDMQKRIRTEFCYVYYMFGKNWNHMHSTVLGKNGKRYSCWRLNFADGTRKTIYFDTNQDA